MNDVRFIKVLDLLKEAETSLDEIADDQEDLTDVAITAAVCSGHVHAIVGRITALTSLKEVE